MGFALAVHALSREYCTVRSSRVTLAREMWEATQEGGAEAALALVEPQVEWIFHVAEGRTFRSDELLAFLTQYEGDREILYGRLYSVQERDLLVVSSGSFRLTGPDGITEHQIHFVAEFGGDDKLLRVRSYPTAAAAAAAAGLEAQPQPRNA
jgi:hypothetical protein